MQGTAVTNAVRGEDMVCKFALELRREAIAVDQSSEGTKNTGNELVAAGAGLRLLMEIKIGWCVTQLPF